VAGYSKRSLTDKLGIKPDMRATVLGAPPGYQALLGQLPEGATLQSKLPATASFVHQCVRSRNQLDRQIPSLAAALTDEGTLWISWPKQASGVATDLNENVVRDAGLQLGLVDIKVCAIDEVWSGLKFVRRVANRGPKHR
jgi:hypothetical protein